LTTGLKNTEFSQIRALFAAVLVRGLLDQDDDWVASEDFLLVCEYAGLGDEQTNQLSDLYFARQLDTNRLAYFGCDLMGVVTRKGNK
jgi:hypothetical protein